MAEAASWKESLEKPPPPSPAESRSVPSKVTGGLRRPNVKPQVVANSWPILEELATLYGGSSFHNYKELFFLFPLCLVCWYVCLATAFLAIGQQFK